MDLMEKAHLSQAGFEATGQSQMGDTGGAAQEGVVMENALKSLQAKVEELQLNLAESMKEKISLASDLAQTKAKLHDLEVERAEWKKDHTETSGGVSKEAARQRLRRLCERKGDGSLSVGEDIHQMWAGGGAGRDKLLKIFMENGLDKVRID